MSDRIEWCRSDADPGRDRGRRSRARRHARPTASGRGAVQHLIDGTTKHAVRREIEMLEARDFLDSLEAPHPMTDGTIEWLHAIAAQVH